MSFCENFLYRELFRAMQYIDICAVLPKKFWTIFYLPIDKLFIICFNIVKNYKCSWRELGQLKNFPTGNLR